MISKNFRYLRLAFILPLFLGACSGKTNNNRNNDRSNVTPPTEEELPPTESKNNGSDTCGYVFEREKDSETLDFLAKAFEGAWIQDDALYIPTTYEGKEAGSKNGLLFTPEESGPMRIFFDISDLFTGAPFLGRSKADYNSSQIIIGKALEEPKHYKDYRPVLFSKDGEKMGFPGKQCSFLLLKVSTNEAGIALLEASPVQDIFTNSKNQNSFEEYLKQYRGFPKYLRSTYKL